MVGLMARIEEAENIDDLVLRARTDAEALGQLYEIYYEPVFRFCVHRLFNKTIAEDVTSTVFLDLARQIASFNGRSQADFRNWLYTIAANQSNAYIRRTSRRKRLLAEAASSIAVNAGAAEDQTDPDWPTLYSAILQLKPKHQTIITLRFFEDMEFEEIAKIINARPTAVRVATHRILKKLREHLKAVADKGE